MEPFAPGVVPDSRGNDRTANDGYCNSQGSFYACGKASVAVERGVARDSAGFLGCERASLQAREERIGGIIQDVHCGECEHRRVVI